MAGGRDPRRSSAPRSRARAAPSRRAGTARRPRGGGGGVDTARGCCRRDARAWCRSPASTARDRAPAVGHCPPTSPGSVAATGGVARRPWTGSLDRSGEPDSLGRDRRRSRCTTPGVDVRGASCASPPSRCSLTAGRATRGARVSCPGVGRDSGLSVGVAAAEPDDRRRTRRPTRGHDRAGGRRASLADRHAQEPRHVGGLPDPVAAVACGARTRLGGCHARAPRSSRRRHRSIAWARFGAVGLPHRRPCGPAAAVGAGAGALLGGTGVVLADTGRGHRRRRRSSSWPSGPTMLSWRGHWCLAGVGRAGGPRRLEAVGGVGAAVGLAVTGTAPTLAAARLRARHPHLWSLAAHAPTNGRPGTRRPRVDRGRAHRRRGDRTPAGSPSEWVTIRPRRSWPP